MLNELKKEANRTLTENGAATLRSTGSDCLDLFATIGALRNAGEQEIIVRFMRAFAEDRDMSMKMLFYSRDIRGGLGERRVFRTILKYLADAEPASVRKNLHFVSEYGRWDDLTVLFGTKCEKEALALIRKQLMQDLSALEAGENVSLLAKWLPSVNTYNADAVKAGKRIAKALGMSDAEYRRTLVKLRAKIRIIENSLRQKDYTFEYSAQPSKAMLKYRKAFRKNDEERYTAYLDSVAKGEETIHTEGHAKILVDIHGMTACDAKRHINNLINLVCARTQDSYQMTVVHGFKHGTSLQHMVRHDLQNTHIKERIADYRNPGITRLVISE